VFWLSSPSRSGPVELVRWAGTAGHTDLHTPRPDGSGSWFADWVPWRMETSGLYLMDGPLVLGTYLRRSRRFTYSPELTCPRGLLPSSLFPLLVMHHGGYVLPFSSGASKHSTIYTVSIECAEYQRPGRTRCQHLAYHAAGQPHTYVRLPMMICPAKTLPVTVDLCQLVFWDVKDCPYPNTYLGR
jgi:hypothetical protein